MTTTHTNITKELLSDTLCAAFEGGSNYWIVSVKRVEPTSWTFESELERDGHWLFDYPLNPGGAVMITTEDEDPYRLDGQAIERGLRVMADQYSSYYQDMVEENGDADTGDVFLQCCLFGDVVYG
jgi:hypothetical protein